MHGIFRGTLCEQDLLKRLLSYCGGRLEAEIQTELRKEPNHSCTRRLPARYCFPLEVRPNPL